jgi:anti-sigma-K factor RskA
MNYRDPQLRDRLASEYVLGTLQGLARKRFERLLRDDADLRRTVAQWQEHLMPIVQAVAPVDPPKRVWKKIEQRIQQSQPKSSVFDSLNFWRGLALFASSFAFALLLFFGVAPQPDALPTYVAVLADSNHQPVMTVRYVQGQRELNVQIVKASEVAADRSLELWTLPKNAAPQSLGLVPASGVIKLKLAAQPADGIPNVPAFAVSLEPKGGSPTGAPTGPVLYSGPLLKI